MLKLEFNEKNKVFINLKKNENLLLLNDKSIYDFIFVDNVLSSIIENLDEIDNLILINMSSSPHDYKKDFYFLNLNKEEEFLLFEKILSEDNKYFFNNTFFDFGLRKENVLKFLNMLNNNIFYSNKKIIIGIDILNIEMEKLLILIKEMNNKNINFILNTSKLNESIIEVCQHKLIFGSLTKNEKYKNNSYIYNEKIINYNISENRDNLLIKKEKLDYQQLLINFENYIIKKQIKDF